jgi:SiaC family regulatory phosphoprotein
MELNIEGTRNSPMVKFNEVEKKFSIVGVSTMSNAREFYQNVLDWLDEFEHAIPVDCYFEFHLPYYNSASNKCIFNVCEKLKAQLSLGRKYTFGWCVEEDDEFMREGGEAIQEILGLNFEFVNKPFNQSRLF